MATSTPSRGAGAESIAAQYVVLQSPKNESSLTRARPGELFRWEVEILKQKGFRLTRADQARLMKLLPEEPQLFVLVPPVIKSLPLSKLITKIELNGIPGQCYVNVDWATKNIHGESKQAHLLLNVRDGRKVIEDASVQDSRQRIQREHRFPYTVWYGIIHAVLFPRVLMNYRLDLVGSGLGSDHEPYFCLDSCRTPTLANGDRAEQSPPRPFIVPSYESRVGT